MKFGDVIPDVPYRRRNAVYAVVFDDKKEKVAVMTVNGKGFLPGGGMNEYEEKEKCLNRECIEETGFSLEIQGYIGQAKQYFQSSKNEYIMNNGYFYTGVFGDFIKVPIDEDHELVYMDLKQAEEILLHRSHIWAVKNAFGYR
ncbi:NUDIX domain-containing protein [Fictibacillus nanhaiensis]|uniref:NUDIX domain-containing protein n=1 Tax=Fictibacillus nanhaiensis TaxID=742169 RepID=UPI001C945BC4|nr:NUDIX domain-containing protein [Fictibacillus nanhaiensis]MBY6035574.1 NUDIX domain-containing protein [Fictibacillus nanhaiensis]